MQIEKWVKPHWRVLSIYPYRKIKIRGYYKSYNYNIAKIEKELGR